MHYLTSLLILILGFQQCSHRHEISQTEENTVKYKIQKSEEEWKALLSKNAYCTLREKGTDRPFTGKYDQFYEEGLYACAGCGQELFSSETKYKSGSGWPSFFDVMDKDRILEIKDTSHGMIRIEVVCSACGGHLGHVFDDGPPPTGLRYCINSSSLEFRKK